VRTSNARDHEFQATAFWPPPFAHTVTRTPKPRGAGRGEWSSFLLKARAPATKPARRRTLGHAARRGRHGSDTAEIVDLLNASTAAT